MFHPYPKRNCNTKFNLCNTPLVYDTAKEDIDFINPSKNKPVPASVMLSCKHLCFTKSKVECATKNGKVTKKKSIPSMFQNTNILKQAGFLMYRLLTVYCTDETLKARQ